MKFPVSKTQFQCLEYVFMIDVFQAKIEEFAAVKNLLFRG